MLTLLFTTGSTHTCTPARKHTHTVSSDMPAILSSDMPAILSRKTPGKFNISNIPTCSSHSFRERNLSSHEDDNVVDVVCIGYGDGKLRLIHLLEVSLYLQKDIVNYIARFGHAQTNYNNMDNQGSLIYGVMEGSEEHDWPTTRCLVPGDWADVPLCKCCAIHSTKVCETASQE